MKRLVLAVVLMSALATAARADVYKCVDPVSGRVTYTNTSASEKGCVLLSRDQPAASGASGAGGAAKRTPTPAGFPKVDSGTQRSRDADRRKILETELAAEERLLADARKELAEQEAQRSGGEKNYQRVLERLKPFQDKVELHQRNVEAIRKEISGLR